MLEKLKEIVQNTDTRVLGQVLKARINLDLFDWIISETRGLLKDSTVKERVYYILSGKPNLSCKNGKSKKFSATRLEYGFCNNIKNCKCFQEQQSARQQGVDMSHVIEKRKATWLSKYGVENISRCDDIKKKRKATMESRTYDTVYRRLAYDKETDGFTQVINRVNPVVTPCFTREEYVGSFRKNVYQWKCVTCGNEFENHIDYGTEPRCQYCYPKHISNGESELKDWITALGVPIVCNDREILGNLELDILIPSKKLAIEFNGVYWHSSKFKEPTYHVNKFLQCKEKGIHLVQIFDDEWNSKKEIVKARLKSQLGISQRIYARKCKVDCITPQEYKSFVEQHHLQGYASASALYGLRYEDQLVAIMSFAKARYSDEGHELIRYCSFGNVVGGASRLFAAFRKEYNPSMVVSYANRCWSNGNLYHQLGFTDVTKQQDNIGFWYVKGNKRYHRTTFNKKRLVTLGYDPALSGATIMDNAGYLKICDCGNYKLKWVDCL